MVCDWFEGGFALVCNDTYTTGRGSDMHIFGYDPQGKTYTWYSVMPTGAATRVLTLMNDGDRWVADWEATYQGKPASYHREWLEESPTVLRYRFTRSVDGGAPILISEWRFTKMK
jgi:trehalose utilization protein